VTGSVAESVAAVLQPASVATANRAPNDASFQGMKPPFSIVKLNLCDRQSGAWFIERSGNKAAAADKRQVCLSIALPFMP
jgi:hypothetical protein